LTLLYFHLSGEIFHSGVRGVFVCVKWGQVGKKEESEGNWSMHNIELKTVQSSEMTHTATADGTSSSNT